MRMLSSKSTSVTFIGMGMVYTAADDRATLGLSTQVMLTGNRKIGGTRLDLAAKERSGSIIIHDPVGY